MRTLIRFFYTHHLFFLFLLLEGMGVFLLVRNNYIQRIAMVNNINVVTGEFYEGISIWRDYLHLKEINQQIIDENISLRDQLEQSFYIADTSYTITDNPYNHRQYKYKPAKVINNTVNKQYNYITLDRGKNQGIAVDMAVIGPDGIVGFVYGVSNNFATVIPVINRDFRVSTKFKKNNFYGSLTWNGLSYRKAILNDIPLHAPVVVGDTLIVSGFSDSFPEGIPVGIVETVEQKDGSFYTIEVLLATDFRKLYDVTVVDDLMKAERENLEKNNLNKE